MYYIYMTSYAGAFVHVNVWHHRPALLELLRCRSQSDPSDKTSR